MPAQNNAIRLLVNHNDNDVAIAPVDPKHNYDISVIECTATQAVTFVNRDPICKYRLCETVESGGC